MNHQTKETTHMKTWVCLVCGWIYAEEEGFPEEGIPPGTRWEDIPDDWRCPECGVSKADFEMMEV
jgi:rubredoxin